MKVKALVDCEGLGYTLKKGETAELEKELVKKLMKFNYVEEVKTKSKGAK